MAKPITSVWNKDNKYEVFVVLERVLLIPSKARLLWLWDFSCSVNLHDYQLLGCLEPKANVMVMAKIIVDLGDNDRSNTLI